MTQGQLLARLFQDLGGQVDFSHLLLAFALLQARILPAIVLTPFLGGESVPSEVKVGLGLLLGLVLFPAIAGQVREVPVSALVYLALMLKELFVGLTLAFVVGMVFEAAQAAGTLVDTLSGTNQAQLMVPMIQQQTSLFSNLQLQLSVVVFLTIGGQHVVIQALGDSLVSLRLSDFPTFQGGPGGWALYDTVIRISADLLRIALALASPVLLATFLTDLALGMINRVAPQVQVFFISMQLKPAVATVVMLTSVHLVLARVTSEYGTLFRWLAQVLSLLEHRR